jgi:hypothetical protein
MPHTVMQKAKMMSVMFMLYNNAYTMSMLTIDCPVDQNDMDRGAPPPLSTCTVQRPPPALPSNRGIYATPPVRVSSPSQTIQLPSIL